MTPALAQESQAQAQEVLNTEQQHAEDVKQALEEQLLQLDAEKEELATSAMQLDRQRQALIDQAGDKVPYLSKRVTVDPAFAFVKCSI